MSAETEPIEKKRWCGQCDCRTIQRAVLDFIGLPVWKCLNCWATVQRPTRKPSATIEKAFAEVCR